MTDAAPSTTRQLRSVVTDDGRLEMSLAETDLAPPGPGEVVVRIEAAPINPSDLGVMLAGADPTTAEIVADAAVPTVALTLSEAAVAALRARVGTPLPLGNEGAGVVVAAGTSDAAQSLVGRVVATWGGSMYSTHRVAPAATCLVLPEGTDPADAASCFVNPLTALGMVETMRAEGHTALAHTAAASNLGQMLVRICSEDGVGLVNIVRRAEQAELLRGLGAEHVCDTSDDDFDQQLEVALAATGATIAFDATGGGTLASRLLSGMERAQGTGGQFQRYGSTVHKQVYIYGGLDRSATKLTRDFGMAWGVGGWLLPNFLAANGGEMFAKLSARVVEGLHTTFASRYAGELSLDEALDPAMIATYGAQATGKKFLVRPSL